ncbi:MAG: hypothetical protein AAB425_15070, partial [Bdellovibrionota bacterium]
AVQAPYCMAKKEIYDPSEVPGPWTKTVSYATLSAKLIEKGVIPNGSIVDHVAVAERFPSGRARSINVSLKGDFHRAVEVLATDFAHFVGLSSTLISFAIQTSGFRIDGHGNGHGAGMSQWGAKALADGLGWDARQILNFYYTDITIN